MFKSGTTGEFTLCTETTVPPSSCTDNDDCSTASAIIMNSSGLPGIQTCLTDCNIGASSGNDGPGNNCYDSPNATVWYTFTTDADAASIDVSLTSTDLSSPVFTIWSGNCPVTTYFENLCGLSSVVGGLVTPSTTYYIAVSDANGDEGDFDLCINQNLDASLCNIGDEIVETNSSDPLTPVGGPYSPGEVVDFCYNIVEYRKENCNWLQGIVPSFGDCWDPASFDADGMPVVTTALVTQGNAAGTWSWHPDGDVQYNDVGASGTLPAGADVGAGWYFICPGCAAGNNGPTVNESYGDGQAAGMGLCDIDGNGFTWSVCFELTAGPVLNCANGTTDCTVSIKTYADAEIGSYTALGCAGDVATEAPASFLCCPIFTVTDTTVCDSYTFPTIVGSGLTGNELYYSGTNGTSPNGGPWSAGDVVNIGDFLTYPATLFVFDVTSCGFEAPFDLTINQTPIIDPIGPLVECDSLQLPSITGTLSGNEGYFSLTGGLGTTFNVGDWITASTSIFIYDETITTPNCFAEEILDITINTALITDNAPVCVGQTVTLTGSGTPNVTNPWVSGTPATATVDDFGVVTGVAAGTTIITYTDANSCTDTVLVTVNALPSVNIPLVTPVCENVAITLNETGGDGTSWLWSSDGLATITSTNSQSPVITNGVDGETFEVIVTDANGCVDSLEVSITVNPLPVIEATPTDPLVCNGTDGFIDVVLNPISTSTGTLSWTGGAIGSNPLADITADSPDISSLMAGSYNVTFTDDNGCVSNIEAVLLNNPGAPVLDLITDTTSCGVDFVLDVNDITGTTTGSQAYYDAGVLGANVIADLTVFDATNTPATIFAIDSNGVCASIVSFTVTVNPIPTVDVTADQALCANALTSAVTFTGNNAGTTYDWVNDDITTGLIASGSGDIAPFTATNATSSPIVSTVTVTPTLNGCTGVADVFTITVDPIPTVDATADQALCANASTTAVTFTGNNAGTTYNWVNDDITTGLAVSGSGDIASFTATNATGSTIVSTVTVTPTLNGCVGVADVFTITVDPIPTVVATADQALCANTSTTAVTFTGNNAGTTYNWVNDDITTGLAVSGSGDIASFTATNATGSAIVSTVTVTPTLNGCVGVADVFTITVDPIPTVDATSNQTLCANVLTSAVTFTGNNAGTTYNWVNDDITTGLAVSGSGDIASFTATNATGSPIVSTVTVTPTLNGCTGVADVFTITVNPIPVISATAADPTACLATDGSIEVVSTLGLSTGALSWTGDATGSNTLADITADSPDITGLGAGTYNITLVDVNGCISNTEVSVLADPGAPSVDAIADQTLCSDDLTSAVTFTGSDAGTTYDWVNDDVATGLAVSGSGDIASFTATNATGSAIVSTVTVTPTLAGCIGASESFTITVNSTPTLTLVDPAAVCEPGLIDITQASVSSSDVGNLSYYTDAALSVLVADATQVSTGVYYVEADNGGCTSSGTIDVTINPLPSAPTAGTDSEYCSTVPFADMTASGGAGTMTWYSDAALTSVISTGPTLAPNNTEGATTYYVTETLNGCEGPESEVIITVNFCEITVPTAFTPDGDGVNDDWEILDIDQTYPENIVFVYNRWGNLLFTSVQGDYDNNRWDGTYNGDDLPVGSYYFIIEYNNEENENTNGVVSIILNK